MFLRGDICRAVAIKKFHSNWLFLFQYSKFAQSTKCIIPYHKSPAYHKKKTLNCGMEQILINQKTKAKLTSSLKGTLYNSQRRSFIIHVHVHCSLIQWSQHSLISYQPEIGLPLPVSCRKRAFVMVQCTCTLTKPESEDVFLWDDPDRDQ